MAMFRIRMISMYFQLLYITTYFFMMMMVACLAIAYVHFNDNNFLRIHLIVQHIYIGLKLERNTYNSNSTLAHYCAMMNDLQLTT